MCKLIVSTLLGSIYFDDIIQLQFSIDQIQGSIHLLLTKMINPIIFQSMKLVTECP